MERITRQQVEEAADHFVAKGKVSAENRERYISDTITKLAKSGSFEMETGHKPGTFPVADYVSGAASKTIDLLNALQGSKTPKELEKNTQATFGYDPRATRLQQLAESMQNLGKEQPNRPRLSKNLGLTGVPATVADVGQKAILDFALTRKIDPLTVASRQAAKLSDKVGRGAMRSAFKKVDLETSKFKQFSDVLEGQFYPVGDLAYDYGISGGRKGIIRGMSRLKKRAGKEIANTEEMLSGTTPNLKKGSERFMDYMRELRADPTGDADFNKLAELYQFYKRGFKPGSNPYGGRRFSPAVPDIRTHASQFNEMGSAAFRQDKTAGKFAKGAAELGRGLKESVYEAIAKKLPDRIKDYKEANRVYGIIKAAEKPLAQEAKVAMRKAPLTQVDAMGLGFMATQPQTAIPILTAKQLQRLMVQPGFLTRAAMAGKKGSETLKKYPMLDSILRQYALEQGEEQ